MALRSAADATFSASANTTPGESSSLMYLSRCTSCIALVTPGVLPTCAAEQRRASALELLRLES